ncbi:hypothetical protein Egran_01157 [Elaphomyces granulatus]|uniref:SWR1-complex protein 4 n=1 Tax=Elaphomyces granulatus TaxID=519963 RepID=A0A232M410_9EURO|nr:hypothetical protein Egran_01157 [Elaphomyces granulatus]
MAVADVRDMLDLPADGHPRPHKKQKVVEKRPEGITRELYALLGERAPPIAITENRYKGRPKWMSKVKVRSWQMTPFTNSARTDNLVLRHWQRQQDTVNNVPPPDGAEMDVDGKPEDEAVLTAEQEAYHFAKYNVRAQMPKRYTDEQYDRHLRSDEWTREETDYLMDLVEEFDLRWVVIADRYECQPQPSDTETGGAALVPAKQHRTMEQMKARYYAITASMLALEHPPSEMSETEFELHEKMVKFDPERERTRKELAALQLNRTADEVREEGILLEELKRIVANEQTFIAERKELYARLEVPISVGNTTMYQSSQGLSQLLQTLMQADKSKKRRSLLGTEGSGASPASQTPTQNILSGLRDSRADTPIGPTPTTATKRTAASNTHQTLKPLTPAEEVRYGVQHHDRLPSGVQFRNDRAQKLTQAKSNIQTQKLAAALAELEVPLRLVMPTERICKEFEKLIHSVNLFLDARKVAEKVESEIRVLEAAREERERKERESVQGMTKDIADVKLESEDRHIHVDGRSIGHAAESEALSDEIDDPGDSEDAPGEADADGENDVLSSTKDTPVREKEAFTTAHKRSASVHSIISNRSTKRQRK